MSAPKQTGEQTPDDVQRRSIHEQVQRHLASRGKAGGPYIIVSILAHGFGTRFGLDHPWIFGWALLTASLGAFLRFLLVARFDEWTSRGSDRWYAAFGVTSFLLAVSLGGYVVGNVIVEGASPRSMLGLLGACAVGAGAMAVLHSDTFCYRMFVLTTLLPPLAVCLAAPDPLARTTGLLILLFVGFLVASGRVLHHQYMDLLQSRELLAERGEQLERARRAADAASRAKSEFLANMSHEIRTPLNGVLGMTQMALESQDERERNEFLGLALKSGESLLGIINDILDLSKIEAGKLTLHPSSFDLRELVGTTMQMLAHRARERSLELVWNVPDSVPARLWGDPNRLRQILINLAGNAVKFTPAGEIVVDFSLERGPGDEVVLLGEVRDTGIGIPPEKQRAIFEAFQQAGHDAGLDSTGTGLGLSICTRLVEMMGGRIEVESREGEGSSFRFRVCVSVDTNDTSSPHEAGTSPIRARVALHRTHPIAAATLRSLIEQTGAGCEVFAGIDEMLSRCASGNYDLAVLELSAHQEEEANVLERLCRIVEQARLPLMLLQTPGGRTLPDLLRHSPQFRGRLLEPAVPSQVREAILRACTASAPTPAPAHECPPDVPSSPSLRILVAEDNRVNQILIESILKKLGHRIETAPDGQAAVDAFARETFDLVLMDIQMPRLDGLEATREIRRREEGSGRRTPIVALTADVVESTEVRCREAGMDAYLLKPFARDEILAVVDWVTPRSAVRE